jgi:putative flippase GtrA
VDDTNILPHWVWQFLVFGLIGVWNTLFDLAVWKVLVAIFSLPRFTRKPRPPFMRLQRVGLNRYSVAQAISFILANTVSFFLNRSITFNQSQSDYQPQALVRFFIVSLTALCVSVLLINFLTKNSKVLKFVSNLNFWEKLKTVRPFFAAKLINQLDWPLVAKLITVIFTLVINFIGYKFWVF